ncbi:unnamed protein product [Arctia plantaginis]|uniref:PiggyBac transposable element-derived protein domain-containing protein n=1 Tax=Arctia plantaginis TaxID=874455 RepID=A0A8S0YVA0_ARCPL|nr:unnamed protein product [Arctia plantaginis]CAB3247891.1 unnamed protein product [Arctia plantaginis]
MSRQGSEDERIRRVLMESDSEDDLLSDSSEKEDHVSTRSQDSDTDQNASSGFDNDGKQPDGPYIVSNKPFDVVNRLVLPISKTGRNVTFDNWFTSYELISHLLKEHKLTSVGTVRKKKRQLPRAFINSRGHSAAIFSSKFAFQNDTTLVSHKKKKTRLLYFCLVFTTMLKLMNRQEKKENLR